MSTPEVPEGGHTRGMGAEMGAQTQLANTVIAYLLSGPLMGGGAGWLLDRLTGLEVFLPVGLIAGMVLSLYVVWLRYGTS